MLKHIRVALATMLAILAVQSRAHSIDEIRRASWNKRSMAELQKLLPDLKAVQDFVEQVLAAKLDVDKEHPSNNTPQVVDYRLVDLRGDRDVELVCLLNFTGRTRPTELMVVENNQGHFATTVLQAGTPGLGIGDLRGIIRDLRHDGANEILIDDSLEPPGSDVVPVPRITHVYVYLDGWLVQSDTDFLDYYKNEVLPNLCHELEVLEQRSPAPNAPAHQLEI